MRPDNTLLGKLGFHDKDKRIPDHDLACNYIASQDLKLEQYYSPAKTPEDFLSDHICKNKDILKACNLQLEDFLGLETKLEQEILSKIEFFDCQNQWRVWKKAKEHPISKGKEQYKSTIGFIDVYLEFRHTLSWKWRLKNDHSIQDEFPLILVSHRKIIFEVKTKLRVSEFLRQVKLYQEYMKGTLVVLVLTSPITVSQQQAVESEGIKIIQLGPKFQAWKEQFSQNTEVAQLPIF